MPTEGTELALTQQELMTLGAGLDVRVRVLDNQAELHRDAADLGAAWASIFEFRVSIRNNSDVSFPASGWTVHLPSIRRLLAIDTESLEVSHVTGDHHLIRPTPEFAGLSPGQTADIDLVGEACTLHVSEFLPRWYLSVPGLEPVVIAATDDDDLGFVEPIGSGNLFASPQDQTIIVTPDIRFARNSDVVSVTLDERNSRVVPTPLRTVPVPGAMLNLTGGISLTQCPGAVGDSMRLWWIDRAATLGVSLSTGSGSGVSLIIEIDPAKLPEEALRPEGYALTVGADEILITSYDVRGANHAMMTLFGLVPAPDERCAIPQLQIYDSPRYVHRGFMIDIGRNMRTPQYLCKLIDQLSAYKLSVLHIHLTEDEGWRIEIPGLPELTEVGSRRGDTENELDRLLAQLGSGPNGYGSASGYLSRSDYVDLLRYAAARGVTVIPEINMPGHCRAAVLSMESRFHRLMSSGESMATASEFRLTDPGDTSRVCTVQNYGMHSALNPSVDGAMNFVSHVLTEISRMHEEAGVPLDQFHTGGDEVSNIRLGAGYCDRQWPTPGLGIIDQSLEDSPWGLSPLARAMANEGRIPAVRALPAHFSAQVDEAVARLGVGSRFAWQDGLEATSQAELRSKTFANVWVPVSEGATNTLIRFQDQGFETIGCAPDFVYFDSPYEAHPAERGTTWATRWLDERIAFSYPPDNPPQAAVIAVGRFGARYRAWGQGELRPMYGIQAHLWSESIRTDDHADTMIFPRLLAVAERAWHRAEWEEDYVAGEIFGVGAETGADVSVLRADFSGFAAVLGTRELAKLDAAGVHYRVPPPGVRIHDDGSVEVNSTFTRLRQLASTDGGDTWHSIEPDFVLERGKSVQIVTLSADGTRRSRVEEITRRRHWLGRNLHGDRN